MFAAPDLAARIDRAEGRLCAGIAQVVASTNPAFTTAVVGLGGGAAIFAGPGSPTNKMIGLGFGSLPTADELGRVEAIFARHGAPLQAEISTLADPALHAMFVARGYEPRGFENVLGHPLTGLASTWPEGIAVAPTPRDRVPEWVDALVSAFATPDTGGVGGDALPASDDLRHWLRLTVDVPGFGCVSATLDGRLVGGGSLRLDEGIAQFCGGHAARLPAPWRADGGAALAPGARPGETLHRGRRHDAAGLEVAAERPARGISAALRKTTARQDARIAGRLPRHPPP